LEEDWTQLFPEARNMRKKALRAFLRLFEPLDMRDEATRFHRKDEVSRHSPCPVSDNLWWWQPVEGAVEFDRAKMARIETEPLFLTKSPGVKPIVPPVVVVPPARADEDAPSHFILSQRLIDQRPPAESPSSETAVLKE
jgi:hypothetical protein